MRKINNVLINDHNYLKTLGNIDNISKTLYCIGNLPNDRIPSVAIVGSRKPTSYGRAVAYKLAFELAQKGVVVVSGLALGIDSIAHKAALDANGITIAILGNAIDKIYPASHKNLSEDIIAKNGAILSEYAPKTPTLPTNFLARNRIISGLSDAVIIVEAAKRSGTLSTANHALNQGKNLFVVPGSINNPLSEGCNNLLKIGANPVTKIDDILGVVAPRLIKKSTKCKKPTGNTPEEKAIISLLHSGEQNGEIIQRKTNIEIGLFNQTLTMLEIKGTIKSLGANQWMLN